MKSTAEVRKRATELQEPFVTFMRRELGGFGEVADQLRVMGYLCEAGLEMAETELKVLKMRDDMARPKVTLN